MKMLQPLYKLKRIWYHLQWIIAVYKAGLSV